MAQYCHRTKTKATNNAPTKLAIKLVPTCTAPLSTATISNRVPPPESLFARICSCCLVRPVGSAALLEVPVFELTVSVTSSVAVEVGVVSGSPSPRPAEERIGVSVEVVLETGLEDGASTVVRAGASSDVTGPTVDVDLDNTGALVVGSGVSVFGATFRLQTAGTRFPWKMRPSSVRASTIKPEQTVLSVSERRSSVMMHSSEQALSCWKSSAEQPSSGRL